MQAVCSVLNLGFCEEEKTLENACGETYTTDKTGDAPAHLFFRIARLNSLCQQHVLAQARRLSRTRMSREAKTQSGIMTQDACCWPCVCSTTYSASRERFLNMNKSIRRNGLFEKSMAHPALLFVHTSAAGDRPRVLLVSRKLKWQAQCSNRIVHGFEFTGLSYRTLSRLIHVSSLACVDGLTTQ